MVLLLTTRIIHLHPCSLCAITTLFSSAIYKSERAIESQTFIVARIRAGSNHVVASLQQLPAPFISGASTVFDTNSHSPELIVRALHFSELRQEWSYIKQFCRGYRWGRRTPFLCCCFAYLFIYLVVVVVVLPSVREPP